MSRDKASARVGDKLLAGWTLLGECCPRAGCAAPLMRSRTPGAPLYCPEHDGRVDTADAAAAAAAPAEPHNGYDDAAHEDARLGPYARAPAPPTPLPTPPLPVHSGSGGAAPPAHAAPPTPVPADQQSAVIADYLLAGWTMLGEACPMGGCYAPLMWQKKDRKKFCPVHKLWVLTEAQATAQRTEAPPPAAPPATPAAPAAPPAAPAASPPAAGDASLSAVAAAATAALRAQMAHAAAALASDTRADLAHTRALVALLAECAAAITAIRAL